MRGIPDKWLNLAAANAHLVRGFLWMVGGSAGRVLASLAYFVAVANTLSIGDFGVFATATATGIMMSRLLAFGFVSPLYRVATVKPRLIGAYTAGLLAGSVLSVPVIVAVGAVMYWLIFSRDMDPAVFALIVASEIFLWRTAEIVIIVLNGLGKFQIGALINVGGIAIRACAAVIFALSGASTLAVWADFYFAANAIAAALAVLLFYPRRRLRWHPALYLRRWTDAIAVSGAEVLFYVQSELDKILVLSIGGPVASGVYAMIMRLVDLTALPVRAFNTLLVQALMRNPDFLSTIKVRIGLEAAVAASSTFALAAMIAILWLFPNALGSNVAEAVPLLAVVFAVPAFRNLVEFHSELLYATGRTVVRTVNLAIIGGMKALLLAVILAKFTEMAFWVEMLNPVFAVLYILSGLLTYRALRRVAKRAI